MKLILSLLEMAQPSETVRGKTYWHGTDTLKAAESIMKNGLDPAHTDTKYGDAQPLGRPVKDHVYLTSKLDYAVIYALGGDMVGTMKDHPHSDAEMKIYRKDPYGYVFEFDGKDLVDVQPDEDSVGELLGNYARALRETPTRGPRTSPLDPPHQRERVKFETKELLDAVIRAWKRVKPAMKVALKRDPWRYDNWIKSGKQALEGMTDADKLLFLDYSHVAHRGLVKPQRAYRFSKLDALKHDKSKPVKTLLQPINVEDLSESLDAPADYKVQINDSDMYEVVANVNGRELIYTFERSNPGRRPDRWVLGFSEKLDHLNAAGMNRTYKKTGKGGSQQAYATLVKFMNDAIKRYRPGVITFSVEKRDPNRASLLKRIVKQHFPEFTLTQQEDRGSYDAYDMELK